MFRFFLRKLPSNMRFKLSLSYSAFGENEETEAFSELSSDGSHSEGSE